MISNDDNRINYLLTEAAIEAGLWDPPPPDLLDHTIENSAQNGQCFEDTTRDFTSAWKSLHGVNSLEGQTDLENARRLAAAYRANLLFCHAWSKWLIWDGCRWTIDENGAAERMAKSIADAIWHAALDKPARRWAVHSASGRGVNAMLALTKSEVPVSVDDLDVNPWLLNCSNGTVNLRTGELREHRREDFITKLCPTEFNPEAESWNWDNCLEAVFSGDESLIGYWRRLIGYSITGDVREQTLTIAWGSGGNGKSTILEAVKHAVGADYCISAAKDLLLAKRGETHPTEVADLFGKRLVFAVETENNRSLAESQVKQLTGGDTIKARRMREDFWEFAPTFKLILVTNHKPRVRGTDHAIWRRLKLVPFGVKFEGENRDKTMPDKLRDEAPGILAWIVRGCLEWQAEGLAEPAAVTGATGEYQNSEDVLGGFLEECCTISDHASSLTSRGLGTIEVKASHLYGAYKQWCERVREGTLNQRNFGDAMTERGFRRAKASIWYYLGIELRRDEGTLWDQDSL